ncbi:hypothetical protein J6590_069229 [Homalodisca vitripennis]|nr:hypothetical protein J6590_069229 [Homalodisca vitripennis]
MAMSLRATHDPVGLELSMHNGQCGGQRQRRGSCDRQLSAGRTEPPHAPSLLHLSCQPTIAIAIVCGGVYGSSKRALNCFPVICESVKQFSTRLDARTEDFPFLNLLNSRATDTNDLPSSINGRPVESTVGSVISPDPGCAGDLGISTDGVLTAVLTSTEVTWVTEVLLARVSKTSLGVQFFKVHRQTDRPI